jgi:hypothetical protein
VADEPDRAGSTSPTRVGSTETVTPDVERQIPGEIWDRIDAHLAQSRCFAATLLYLKTTGCGIRDAKDVIGYRFRERFPELWANYQDVDPNETD